MNNWFMRISLSIFIILILPKVIAAQTFEGEIDFEVSFEVKQPDPRLEQLIADMGSKVNSKMSKGFYLEISNGAFMQYHLHRPDSCSIFFKHSLNDDTLRQLKTDLFPATDFTYSIEENVDTILGYPCNKLTVNDSYGTKIYYFAPSLPVNPEDYQCFLMDNKYQILNLTHSVYLKFEHKNEFFDSVVIAKNITWKDLPLSIFDLPTFEVLKLENE